MLLGEGERHELTPFFRQYPRLASHDLINGRGCPKVGQASPEGLSDTAAQPPFRFGLLFAGITESARAKSDIQSLNDTRRSPFVERTVVPPSCRPVLSPRPRERRSAARDRLRGARSPDRRGSILPAELHSDVIHGP